MSKIGFKIITVPDTVNIVISNNNVEVNGPKGVLSFVMPRYLNAHLKEGQLSIIRKGDTKVNKSMHGLVRSLIANAVYGVVNLWVKKLEVVGTGFTVKPSGIGIVLKLGFSHPVEYQAPEGIQIQVEENNVIAISGVNRQKVGEIAYQIKSIKHPDVYKGKGIRYLGEYIKLKPGKKVKTE